MNNHTPENLPYPHDLAEDIAWAQKPYLDVAFVAMQNAAEAESHVLQGMSQDSFRPTVNTQPTTDFVDHPLTSNEAAAFLGVSRPHLVNTLLETGIIGFYKVGHHRRIMLSEVMGYIARREQESLARLKK